MAFRRDLRYAVTLIQRLTELLEDGPAVNHMRKAEINLLLAKQVLGCREENALAVILKPFRKQKQPARARKRKPFVIRRSSRRNHL